MNYRMSLDGGEWIELSSWSWGMSNPGARSGGSGGGSGTTADFQDFAVTKETDWSSTQLMSACAGGRPLGEVIIDFYRVEKGGPETTYMQWVLEDAIVTSFQAGGGSDGATPTEEVSFYYNKIVVRYQGSDDPDGSEFSWNLETNSPG